MDLASEGLSYNPDDPAQHDEGEATSRFAFEDGYFRSGDGTVKPKAFRPDRQGEVSMFRTCDLEDGEIWQLGDDAGAERIPAKAAIARCELTIAQVRSVGLLYTIAEPPTRHAVINGWPADDGQSQLKSLQLAQLASLRRR